MGRAANDPPRRGLLGAWKWALAAAGFVGGLAVAVAVLREEPASPRVATLPDRASGPSRRAGLAFPPELASDPDVLLALKALRDGLPAEAADWFQRVRERHPGRPEPLIALAQTLLTLDDTPRALAALREAVELDPRDFHAQLFLGDALYRQGEEDAAEKAYLRAAEIDPSDPRAHYWLGRIAAGREQAEVARKEYRKAVAADPTYAPAVHYLSNSLRDDGRFAEAARLLSTALERAPNDSSLRLSLAHTYFEAGRAQEAAREFEEAIRSRPRELPEAYHFLGASRELLGDEEGAMEAYRKAVEHDRYVHMSWYALAQLLARRGDAEGARRAREAFEEARDLRTLLSNLEEHLRRNPRDTRALLELSRLYIKRGKPRRALGLLGTAASLGADESEVERLLEAARRAAGRGGS